MMNGHNIFFLNQKTGYLKGFWPKTVYLKALLYSKSLSWAKKHMYNLFTVIDGRYPGAQVSDLEYFFEAHRIFWQKATFSNLVLWTKNKINFKLMEDNSCDTSSISTLM